MKKWIASWFLRLGGWQVEGEKPPYDRYVLIAAPHTSNWDFPLMLAFATMFDIKVNWLAKHSLFRPPFGGIMKAMGGIPVVRHKNRNMVADMIESFNQEQEAALVIPTEGSRARTEYWKSGFYHIAMGAGVPIVPSYLDFRRKCGGFGPAFIPTGDLNKDMDYFRNFYQDKVGKFPENFGPIGLREEREGD